MLRGSWAPVGAASNRTRSFDGYEGDVAVGTAPYSFVRFGGTAPEPGVDGAMFDVETVWERFSDRGSGRLGRTSETLVRSDGMYRD